MCVVADWIPLCSFDLVLQLNIWVSASVMLSTTAPVVVYIPGTPLTFNILLISFRRHAYVKVVPSRVSTRRC
jgi:hypothetical protein